MKHIPMGTFVAFCVKALIISPNSFEVAVIAVSACLAAFYYNIELNRKIDKHVELQNKKISDLEKLITDQKVILDGVSNGVSSLRLAQGMSIKNVQNR